MKLTGKITAVVLGVAMAVSVLAGCGSGTADDTKQTGQAQQKENKEEAGGLRTVSIQIDGAAVPYYAPLYMAQEKGYCHKCSKWKCGFWFSECRCGSSGKIKRYPGKSGAYDISGRIGRDHLWR